MVESVTIERVEKATVSTDGRVPIKIFIFFKLGIQESQAQYFVQFDVRNILLHFSNSSPDRTFVDESGGPVQFETILDEKTNQIMARVVTQGIVRHPAQLYESISCVVLFVFLFSIWRRYKLNLPEGRIFGFFMIILWSLRFLYEYLKENQVPFEANLPLNMGQILSIPLVLVGIFILVRSYRKQQENS